MEYPDTYELGLGKKDRDNIPECWFWVSEWCPGLDPGLGRESTWQYSPWHKLSNIGIFRGKPGHPPPPQGFPDIFLPKILCG